jgi:hypothetical protein
MSSLRGRLKSLERGLEEDMIIIPQADGTVERFPASAALDAFLVGVGRLRAHHLGEEAPDAHPLTTAARNSPAPKWHGSFFAVHVDPDEEIPDLSE